MLKNTDHNKKSQKSKPGINWAVKATDYIIFYDNSIFVVFRINRAHRFCLYFCFNRAFAGA